MSYNGRLGSASSERGFNARILYLGVDASIVTALPPNSEVGSYISGDGTYLAGFVYNTTVQASFPARRLGTQVEVLTTTYRGKASAINGDGSVIAAFAEYPFGPGPRYVAYRWTPANGVQFLVDPFDPNIFHTDIKAMSSDASVMCGVADDVNTGTFAFRWTAAQGIQHLPMPADTTFAAATGMSSDGRLIVGTIHESGVVNQVMWTPDGMIDMGRAVVNAEHPFAISRTGVAVLGGDQPSSGTAAIWSAQTGRVDLDDYLRGFGVDVPNNWLLWSCRAISDDGLTFSGTALLPDGSHRGFVATVPSPISVSLFAMMVGCTSLPRRRRS